LVDLVGEGGDVDGLLSLPRRLDVVSFQQHQDKGAMFLVDWFYGILASLGEPVTRAAYAVAR